MEIKQRFLTKNDCYKAGKPFKPTGIMVHSIGCPQPSADFFASNWNTPRPNGIQVCVHAFVDDTEIIQTLPWTMRGWHAGGSANNTHIGFEMTEPAKDWSEEKKADFFYKAYSNAVALCASLCTSFNFNPMTQIICHCEGHRKGIASNHADVMHWFPKHGKSMDMFRREVKELMEKKPESSQKLDNTPSPHAREALNWAIQNRVVLGDSETGNLRLHDPVTREECLVFIHRAKMK